MKRRDVVTLAVGAATWPFTRLLAAEAQRQVGALLYGTDNDPQSQSFLGAFWERLATFGWIEGRNLRIDYRFGGGDPSLLTTYAEELVNLRPDVIFAYGGPAAVAVRRRTSVIPIVFVGRGDPASMGMVLNIARPEGNETGFANIYGSLGGKWIELFKEAVPGLARVADVFPASAFDNGGELRATILAAAQLGVTIIRMPVRRRRNTATGIAVEKRDLGASISAFAAEPGGGLLLTEANPPTIVEAIARLALDYHLPLMHGGAASNAGREGVLMAHGPDMLDLVRRASSYVDRILRGAKPADLPVQFPTKFEVVVNLKTAKAIGVTIPEAFLAGADRVIE